MNKESIEFLVNFVKSMQLQPFFTELLKWASIGLVAVLLWFLHKRLNKDEPKVVNYITNYYSDKKE